jgi:hypothetical protein
VRGSAGEDLHVTGPQLVELGLLRRGRFGPGSAKNYFFNNEPFLTLTRFEFGGARTVFERTLSIPKGICGHGAACPEKSGRPYHFGQLLRESLDKKR